MLQISDSWNHICFSLIRSNIELSFETDNFNDDLVKYIKKRKKKFNSVGLTFDVGNIFIKNKNVNRVFSKNQNIINHIHLKDRNMYNQNVELGKGLINFKSFFKTLMKQNYNGEIWWNIVSTNTRVLGIPKFLWLNFWIFIKKNGFF